MSNDIDAVSGHLDKHLYAEQRYEMWLDENQEDLADEYYETYGLNGFDSRMWEKFLESRYETKDLE
jgi:hypothetical protein